MEKDLLIISALHRIVELQEEILEQLKHGRSEENPSQTSKSDDEEMTPQYMHQS